MKKSGPFGRYIRVLNVYDHLESLMRQTQNPVYVYNINFIWIQLQSNLSNLVEKYFPKKKYND